MEQVVPKGGGRPNDIIKISIEARESVDFSPLEGVADYKKALKVWQDPVAYSKALRSFATNQMNHANLMENLLSEKPADCEAARAVAHALKGVAGNLSINGVADLAAVIDGNLKLCKVDEAKSHLSKLHESLLEVAAAIAKLKIYDDNMPLTVKDFDAEAVKRLLCELITALDELNPDAAEPVLLKLADYIVKSDLKPIQLCIEAFDFDEAKNKVFALSDKFALSLE